jgi:hypothetical protein
MPTQRTLPRSIVEQHRYAFKYRLQQADLRRRREAQPMPCNQALTRHHANTQTHTHTHTHTDTHTQTHHIIPSAHAIRVRCVQAGQPFPPPEQLLERRKARTPSWLGFGWAGLWLGWLWRLVDLPAGLAHACHAAAATGNICACRCRASVPASAKRACV